MPNGDDCDAVREAYEQALADYEAAAHAEYGTTLDTWMKGGKMVAANVATIGCWVGLEAPSFGLATGLCVASSLGTLVADAEYGTSLGKDDLAESALEDAEAWRDAMEEAYCFCLENDGFSSPPALNPPFPPAVSDEEYFDYPTDDDEDDSACCSDS